MIGLAVAYAGLLVSVATLLWRVWRLEAVAKQAHEWGAKAIGADSVRRSFEARDRVDDDLRTDWVRTDARLHQFARALGYEWKRTDAKEGWERKSPFGVGDVAAYKKAIEDSIAAPIWVRGGRDPREYDWTLPTTNRRKADRRKPVIAKAADDPFPSPLDRVSAPKKKPRRAH